MNLQSQPTPPKGHTPQSQSNQHPPANLSNPSHKYQTPQHQLQNQATLTNQQQQQQIQPASQSYTQRVKQKNEQLQNYKYYPLELEPIFNYATRNLQRLVRKNIRVLLALEEKKRLGTYKPIISKEELDRIKIGLSVGVSVIGGPGERLANHGGSSRVISPETLHNRALSANKPALNRNQMSNDTQQSLMHELNQTQIIFENNNTNNQALHQNFNQTQNSNEINSPEFRFKSSKRPVPTLNIYTAKNKQMSSSQDRSQNIRGAQQKNINFGNQDKQMLLMDEQQDENDGMYQLDQRFDQLGKMPEFKIDSERAMADQENSYRDFINNQIRIQQQLLQTINKDEIIKQMESLCKDFLEAIINSKSYDIKMSMIDIINLPKDDNGQPNQNLIKERQKQQFTMALYQDEIDELKQRMGELRIERDKYLSKFVQAKDQNKELHNVVSTMRAAYAKELQNLRDSLVHKQRDKNYQYTEVRFFDTVATMDEGTKAMLNTKISDVQRMYEDTLKNQQEKLEVFQRQIIMFEKLCEDGNMLVSLDELNALDICKKMAIVEKEPKVLWKAIETVFGFGFFLPIIEEEFGITPAFKEQITKQYNEELNKARYETQNKVNKFANSVKNELDIFRRIIGKKNQEMSLIHSAQLSKFETSLNEAKAVLEISFQNQLDVQVRQIRDKVMRLETKLEEKESVARESVAEIQRTNLKFIVQKWAFKSKLQKLIEDFARALQIKQQEKQGKFVEQNRFNNDQQQEDNQNDINNCHCKVEGQIYKLKEIYNNFFNAKKQFKRTQLLSDQKIQYDSLFEKYQEQIRLNASLKLKCQHLDSNNNYYKYLATQQQVSIETLSNVVQDNLTKTRVIEQENSQKNQAFEEQRYYIELLEKEMDRLNTLFRRMVAQNPAFVFFQQNPIQGLEQLRFKVKNEVNKKTLKTMGRVLKDHMREKFAQTDDLCDLKKEIIYKPFSITDPDFKFVQSIDEGCQIGCESVNNHATQTDQVHLKSIQLNTDMEMNHIELIETENEKFKDREASKAQNKRHGDSRYNISKSGVNKKRKHRKTQDQRSIQILNTDSQRKEGIDPLSYNQSAENRSKEEDSQGDDQEMSPQGTSHRNLRKEKKNKHHQHNNDHQDQDFSRQDSYYDGDSNQNHMRSGNNDKDDDENHNDEDESQNSRNDNGDDVNTHHGRKVNGSKRKVDDMDFEDEHQKNQHASPRAKSADQYHSKQNLKKHYRRSIHHQKINQNHQPDFMEDGSKMLLRQLLIREGIDPIIIDYFKDEKFRQNVERQGQGSIFKNMRVTQTGGGSVQINVQPKYEIVSFNLKCLENSLNKKLGLVDRRNRGIQTDPIIFNQEGEIQFQNYPQYSKSHFKSRAKRLLNNSQLFLENQLHDSRNNVVSQSTKQSIFSQKGKSVYDSTIMQKAGYNPKQFNDAKDNSLLYQNENMNESLTHQNQANQMTDFNKTSINMLSNTADSTTQFQPSSYQIQRSSGGVNSRNFKKRNQSLMDTSLGEVTENLSIERIQDSKYQSQINQIGAGGLAGIPRGTSANIGGRIIRNRSRLNDNQQQQLSFNHQRQHSRVNTALGNYRPHNKHQALNQCFSNSTQNKNINSSQQSFKQNKNRRDIQGILLQQFYNANAELEAVAENKLLNGNTQDHSSSQLSLVNQQANFVQNNNNRNIDNDYDNDGRNATLKRGGDSFKVRETKKIQVISKFSSNNNNKRK